MPSLAIVAGTFARQSVLTVSRLLALMALQKSATSSLNSTITCCATWD